MDPQYQQTMINALMGGQNGSLPGYATGQNPVSPSGQNFMTGNNGGLQGGMLPGASSMGDPPSMGPPSGAMGAMANPYSSLTTPNISQNQQQLMQPAATYGQ